MDSPERPNEILAEIAHQLTRIADAIEALGKGSLSVRTVIEQCPVIRIRSN